MKLAIAGAVTAALSLSACQGQLAGAIDKVNSLVQIVCGMHTVLVVPADATQAVVDFAATYNLIVATLCPPSPVPMTPTLVGE